MNSRILVISTSLNPESNSRKLCHTIVQELEGRALVELISLSDYPLPLCDGDSAYSAPEVAQLSRKVREADCILLGVPIYNYDVSAAAKNLVELTGKAWTGKPVGFLCAAGGKSSYMSVMSFAQSLMLDFRCVIIPRFVYAEGSSFNDTALEDREIEKRVEELAREAERFAGFFGRVSSP